jgi:hypothetical protein
VVYLIARSSIGQRQRRSISGQSTAREQHYIGNSSRVTANKFIGLEYLTAGTHLNPLVPACRQYVGHSNEIKDRTCSCNASGLSAHRWLTWLIDLHLQQLAAIWLLKVKIFQLIILIDIDGMCAADPKVQVGTLRISIVRALFDTGGGSPKLRDSGGFLKLSGGFLRVCDVRILHNCAVWARHACPIEIGNLSPNPNCLNPMSQPEGIITYNSS